MPPNTKRKTKNKRKTRKIKGGFWCMFEHKDNQDCLPENPVISSVYYYYYLNEDTFGEKTLFAYKPHVFKHFDEIFPNLKPLPEIANFETTGIHRGSYRIKFHKDSENRPGNLQRFIYTLNNYIDENDLSYTKLLATNTKKSSRDDENNISVFLDSNGVQIEIWWQKKKRPKELPFQINRSIDETTYKSEINYCIQITHIHDYDDNKNRRSILYTTPTPTTTPITSQVVSARTATSVSSANSANLARTSIDHLIEDNKHQKFINTRSVDKAKHKAKMKKALDDIKK